MALDWKLVPPDEGPPVFEWLAPHLPLKGMWPWYKVTPPPPPPPDKGTLNLNFSPANAVVTAATYIPGGIGVGTPFTLSSGQSPLPPGNYMWGASATGYVTQSGTFIIAAGQTTNLPITLVQSGPSTGTVTFTLPGYNQYTEVAVWVDDGDSYGFEGSPIMFTLPAGQHIWHSINQKKNTNNQQSGTFTIIAGQDVPITLSVP